MAALRAAAAEPPMNILSRRDLLAALSATPFAAPFGARAETQVDVWPGLVADLFQNRPIVVDATVALDAPVRAEDAAIVPMTLRLGAPTTKIKTVTLVIDQNPMPMAAAFTLGEKSGVAFLSTRVRVNSYSNVHAVAETRDGALHGAVKFVKASGGCSAPAGKNADEVAANLGRMKYREFKSADPALREAQLMIRHPNNSGMQMDQLTHLYIPAHYVEFVELRQGEELIFTMEGGISLSEDPNFRFAYTPNGAKTLFATVRDSRGTVFKGDWPIGEAS
jgi:sulfur-oxidizing protein SoxY